jgi:hypothetical protein
MFPTWGLSRLALIAGTNGILGYPRNEAELLPTSFFKIFFIFVELYLNYTL